MNLISRLRKSITFRLLSFLKNNNRLSRLSTYGVVNLTVSEVDSLELIELCQLDGTCNIIYDVGANRGTWSVLAAGICPKSQIHAFEPMDIEKIAGFRKKNIHFHKIALGSSNTTETIHITNDIDSSSLMKPTSLQKIKYNSYETEKMNISVVKLDDYAAKKQLPFPDLLKLDVQGYELEVLKGAPHLLKRVKFIIMEVSFEEFYKGQPLFNDVVIFMNEAGFNIKAFGINTTVGAKISQTDILFEKKK